MNSVFCEFGLVMTSTTSTKTTCRGGIMADAIGWLEFGADGCWRHRGGFVRRDTHTKNTNTHGFTQVQGPREEARPLLLLV